MQESKVKEETKTMRAHKHTSKDVVRKTMYRGLQYLSTQRIAQVEREHVEYGMSWDVQ